MKKTTAMAFGFGAIAMLWKELRLWRSLERLKEEGATIDPFADPLPIKDHLFGRVITDLPPQARNEYWLELEYHPDPLWSSLCVAGPDPCPAPVGGAGQLHALREEWEAIWSGRR